MYRAIAAALIPVDLLLQAERRCRFLVHTLSVRSSNDRGVSSDRFRGDGDDGAGADPQHGSRSLAKAKATVRDRWDSPACRERRACNLVR